MDHILFIQIYISVIFTSRYKIKLRHEKSIVVYWIMSLFWVST